MDSPLWKDDYSASYTLAFDVAASDAIDGTAPIPDHEKARFTADLRKALAQDYTRGGYAVNTIFGSDSSLQADAGPVKLLDFTVHYRTAYQDPFSL